MSPWFSLPFVPPFVKIGYRVFVQQSALDAPDWRVTRPRVLRAEALEILPSNASLRVWLAATRDLFGCRAALAPGHAMTLYLSYRAARGVTGGRYSPP